MLVACLPLLVGLLGGLTSTVIAQTLDHQQLDISGNFGDNNLSKRPTLSVEDSSEFDEPRIPFLNNLENVISGNLDSFNSNDEFEAVRFVNSAVSDRYLRTSHINKMSAIATAGLFPCPVATDIAPCVCTVTDTNELMMDCSAVESDAQLAAVFSKTFPVKEFLQFQIVSNNNIHFLADIFNGVSFRLIYLSSVPNLAQITSGAFADSKYSLESISILITALTEVTFPFSTLNEYTKLTYLQISASNITFLPAFNSSSLQTLWISSAPIPVLLGSKMNDFS